MLLQSVVRTKEERFQSLHAYLTWDHHRLEDALANVVKEVEGGDIHRGLRALSHYERGLRRHIRIEEETVFQLYANERTGAARSPKAVIEAEHARMLDDLGVMREALEKGNVATFRELHAALSALLRDHERTEQSELYPYIDALLGAAESEKLVARFRAE